MPPPSKVYGSPEEAVADVQDGASILVAGYGEPGAPQRLVRALAAKGVSGLTCISGPWYGRNPALYDVPRLVNGGQVARAITSTPLYPDTLGPVLEMWKSGKLELDIVPQGILAERIRAGGAGLGGVYLPDQEEYDSSESTTIDGSRYALHTPLTADFAFLRAHVADTLGNLVYLREQRNWNPIMAMSARVVIAEVDGVVQQGELDGELIVTPGIYVDRIVPAGEG